MESELQIGELNLRMPGGDSDVGRRVAEGAAERLANGLHDGMNRRIGVVNVRVRVPAGAGETEISGAIAEAIENSLAGKAQ